MDIRKLSKEEAIFSITPEEEDIPVRGNLICSDDPQYNKAAEDKVIEEYNRGNIWAWCCVKVVASWKVWKGVAFLGGCSYKSEEDFVVGNSDYYDALCQEALDELNKSVRASYESITELLTEDRV